MDIKAELIKIGVILLPIVSMLIPKVLGDARTRKLLSTIEVGADLKSTAYVQIIAEVTVLKNLLTELLDSKELFLSIKEVFESVANEVKLLDVIKKDIKDNELVMIELMEMIQKLMLAAYNTNKVSEEIEIQSNKIQEMNGTIKKLNTRLGGK